MIGVLSDATAMSCIGRKVLFVNVTLVFNLVADFLGYWIELDNVQFVVGRYFLRRIFGFQFQLQEHGVYA